MRQRACLVGAPVLAAAALIAIWPGVAVSAASKAGDATVVAPGDNTAARAPLTRGTTATPFSLQLPAQAACTGDSNNGGYRVQSYMVPASVDPGNLQYGSVGPLPSGTGAKFRQALFDLNTNQYVNAQTAMATKPGGPGPIINIPAFNFSVFKAGDVPAGLYNIGIACTKGPASSSQLDKFWNTQITVAAGPGGAAGPVAWSTPGAASTPGSAGNTGHVGAPSADAGNAPGASGGGAGAEQSAASGASASAKPQAVHHVAAKPTGAPPSFGDPVGDVRAFIPIPGGSPLGLLLWALIAVVAARIAFLVFRRQSKFSAAAL
jgi:hypothetical protein